MKVDIYLPVWFVGNRFSIEVDCSEHGVVLILEFSSQCLFQIEILY